MCATISLNVNGKTITVTTEPQRSLLDVLREDLGLTGTKYGCGEGECGACSVLLDERRAFACSTPIAHADGKSVRTIEGLASGETLHPVQEAFLAESAFQCGYCTSGMIVATVALLRQTPHPTDAEIIAGMNGNVCRCGGYARMINAVKRAAAAAKETAR
jgi:carbon-monoxide dehydrogenase small subunit